MQRKKNMILKMWIGIIPFLLMSGCGFEKESVLEHSGHEFEVFTEKNAEDPSQEIPVITGEIFEDSSGVDKNSTQDSASEYGETEEYIYVYICGQVQCPGVYQVAPDTRVFSVIQLAGGLTEAADAIGVNQAQTLADGQMIYIPAIGEELSADMITRMQNGFSKETNSGKVNINSATLEELMCLPGIGEGKAQSILKYRQEHGSFQSIDEIMNVEGIKEGTYSKFKDQITI